MRQAFIDANVILRYLTKDPPEMAEAALIRQGLPCEGPSHFTGVNPVKK